MLHKKHIKLLLIGNAGSGKSALMNQYVNCRFTNYYRSTIGTDFFTKELQVNDKLVTVQVSPQEAEEWCKMFHAKYFETSAKEARNVEEAFLEAIKLALNYHQEPDQNWETKGGGTREDSGEIRRFTRKLSRQEGILGRLVTRRKGDLLLGD